MSTALGEGSFGAGFDFGTSGVRLNVIDAGSLDVVHAGELKYQTQEAKVWQDAMDALLADGSARRAALATIGAAYRAARRLWRKGVSAAPAPGSIGTGSGSAIRLLSLDELRARETRRAFAELAQRRGGHDARVKAEARREAGPWQEAQPWRAAGTWRPGRRRPTVRAEAAP